jgi:hypothetical protein
MSVVHAFWSLDFRSFYFVNQAYITLLRKKMPECVKDYHPISLIHSISKLLTKTLSRRLAPWMNRLVKPNQSAFIKGRAVHDNFRAVQFTAKLLHAHKRPMLLLKIDIARAFDTVTYHFWSNCYRTWASLDARLIRFQFSSPRLALKFY